MLEVNKFMHGMEKVIEESFSLFLITLKHTDNYNKTNMAPALFIKSSQSPNAHWKKSSTSSHNKPSNMEHASPGGTDGHQLGWLYRRIGEIHGG